jgi:hypothetical protein
MEMTESKRSKIYNEPSTRLKREEEVANKKEADRLEPLRERHRKQKGEMQNRHRQESVNLGGRQRVEHDYHEQFSSRPAGLDANHKKARSELDRRHRTEREALKEKHEKELAAAQAHKGHAR